MTKFTEEQKELLLHLMAGGLVKEQKDLFGEGATSIDVIHLQDGVDMTPFMFANEYCIHYTPEQKRIMELEKQLRIQGEELQKALAKKEESKSRRRRPKLSAGEVADIIKAINAKVPSSEIESTYDVSDTTVSKIRIGKHTLQAQALAILSKEEK